MPTEWATEFRRLTSQVERELILMGENLYPGGLISLFGARYRVFSWCEPEKLALPLREPFWALAGPRSSVDPDGYPFMRVHLSRLTAGGFGYWIEGDHIFATNGECRSQDTSREELLRLLRIGFRSWYKSINKA